MTPYPPSSALDAPQPTGYLKLTMRLKTLLFAYLCVRRFYVRPVNSVLLVLFSFALLLGARAADTPLSDPAVGTTDATGRLVIHVFDADTKTPHRTHLSTDYGILMFHAADGWVCFTIAHKSKNSVREFTNYDAYLDVLAELPKGSH